MCNAEAKDMFDKNKMQNVNAAVVGAGSSGLAAAALLLDRGAQVRILDRNTDALDTNSGRALLEKGVRFYGGPHQKQFFEAVTLVVMSPGVPVAKIKPFLPNNPRPEVVGELELASRFVSKPILAVTGTNGKTTVTSLAARMLEKAGKSVFLGGNIGTPLSAYALSRTCVDVCVLEVSSFQLQTCSTFHPWVAVLLNLSPNHLDYHVDMHEYVDAKMNLFARQDEDDLAIVPADLKSELQRRGFNKARICQVDPKGRFVSDKLPGTHNQFNMEAAYQAARFFGVTETEAQAAINQFDALPHRLERVGELKGVSFIDDSKATTVDALRAALQCFDKPVRLLAGGKFKGGDLKSLLPLMREKVKEVGLYGASEDVFRQAWNGDVPVFWEKNLEQAMRRHFADAAPGEVVLLSPATSSYDQYPDYMARGDDFKRIVKELACSED